MKLPFDSIILINLKRRKDKLERMNIRLAESGIDKHVKVIRLDAIDGLEINDEWLETNNFKPLPDYYDPFRGRSITMGEIGCGISHFMAWKMIHENPEIECALILEDDARFEEDFLKKIEKLNSDIEKTKWDLFYLGRKKINKKPEKIVLGDIVEPNFSYWCLSYMVNKKGAKKLIESGYNNAIIPADEFVPIMNDTPATFCTQFVSNYKRQDFKGLGLKTQLIVPENWAFNHSETEKTEIYFKNEFYDDKIDKFILITVATEENDKLERFRKSCEYFGVPYKILGLGHEWKGGDAEGGVLKSFGGGQKINLLRRELKSWLNLKDHIVMFTDSYDVLLLANPADILRHFRSFGAPIVFSAEKTCWPDPKLKDQYPAAITDYRFLNSGGFIGYADWISKLISDPINDNEDDQLYYTQRFFKTFKTILPSKTIMELPSNEYPKSAGNSKMGWMSEPVFDNEVIQHLIRTQEKDAKILDIGPGDGKWGFLLNKHFENIEAVEVFEPYVERYKLNEIYKTVHISDILDFEFDYYDVLIMGDVFEHLPQEKAQEWLKKIQHKCKEIIVIVPYEYEQTWDGVYENKWGHHHQDKLTPDTMQKLYPELHLVKWTDIADSAEKGKGFGFYIKTYNFHVTRDIVLDSKQVIFQTLNQATDDITVDKLGKVINQKTKTFPCVLHGNGPREVKEFLDNVGNFVSGKFDEVYGFRNIQKIDKNKKICIGVFFYHELKYVQEVLDRLEWLKYPKERINLKFFYNNEAHDYYFGKFSERNKGYGSLEFFKREKHLDSIIEFLNSDMDVDVYMVMESNYIFRNEDSLKVLLNSDIKILAPMIVSEKSDFANFHVWNTGLKKSYQTYSNKGFWTVDIISGIILISKDFVQTTKEILLDKTNHSDGDWDVKLSEGLKKKDYFAYICNTNYFGTII